MMKKLLKDGKKKFGNKIQFIINMYIANCIDNSAVVLL